MLSLFSVLCSLSDCAHLLLLMAFATLGRAHVFLCMTTFAGLVRPILAEPFDLTRALLMAHFAILQRFLVLLVVEGNIAVLGREGNGISRHRRCRAKEGKHNRRNNLFQKIHLHSLDNKSFANYICGHFIVKRKYPISCLKLAYYIDLIISFQR